MVKIKLPRMEAFNEKVDSMDAYLRRFERTASNANWAKHSWAKALATLLKGRALEIYNGLGTHHHDDFDALKLALMKGFGISADGMMETFR